MLKFFWGDQPRPPPAAAGGGGEGGFFVVVCKQRAGACRAPVSVRAGPGPSCGPMRISYSPVSSVNQAIDLPSGDQTGERSFAPGDWVRFRSSPFSAGTVMKIGRA